MPGAYDDLHGTLQLTLLQRLGWTALRPLQEETCRAAATGADLLVIAPTAGGKTEAALIPVVDRALKEGASGVYCIYLSPLKALINDQLDRIEGLCLPGRLSTAAFHGDIPPSERRRDPDDEPHVLLITPESLEILLHSPASARRFAPLRYIVIDEVHAFVGTDRGVQVRAMLDRLDRAAGRPVQRIGLSATVGNPADVLAWLSGPGRQRELSTPGPEDPEEVLVRRRAGRAGQGRRNRPAGQGPPRPGLRLVAEPGGTALDPARGPPPGALLPPLLGLAGRAAGGRSGGEGGRPVLHRLHLDPRARDRYRRPRPRGPARPAGLGRLVPPAARPDRAAGPAATVRVRALAPLRPHARARGGRGGRAGRGRTGYPPSRPYHVLAQQLLARAREGAPGPARRAGRARWARSGRSGRSRRTRSRSCSTTSSPRASPRTTATCS